MELSSSNPIKWSQLTQEEIENGIHPEKLCKINFDINENVFSEKFNAVLEHFFLGCRLAASESEFLHASIKILNSTNESQFLTIKLIAQKVLYAHLPKENLIEDAENASVHFENEEYGSPYRKCIHKFVNANNQLIAEGKAYLMHPARRLELINYLKPLFSDSELSADRLIKYRCFGKSGLDISEYNRSVHKYGAEIDQINKQLTHLFDSGPNQIKDPMDLKEENLDCIPIEYCRKYVCLAYQHLALNNRLHILDLSEKDLYDYSDKYCYPDLASVAAKYDKEITSGGKRHFGTVVRYLKALRNSDLNDLKKLCIDEENERLQWLSNYVKKKLKGAQVEFQNQLKQFKISAEKYKPGDFSFLSEPMTIRILSNAYNAVEKLNAWPFFDLEPPENKGYMFWNHPMVNTIGNELDSDGHSGASMGFTMRWMQRIRKLGWNRCILENKELESQEMGVLNTAKL